MRSYWLSIIIPLALSNAFGKNAKTKQDPTTPAWMRGEIETWWIDMYIEIVSLYFGSTQCRRMARTTACQKQESNSGCFSGWFPSIVRQVRHPKLSHSKQRKKIYEKFENKKTKMVQFIFGPLSMHRHKVARSVCVRAFFVSLLSSFIVFGERRLVICTHLLKWIACASCVRPFKSINTPMWIEQMNQRMREWTERTDETCRPSEFKCKPPPSSEQWRRWR